MSRFGRGGKSQDERAQAAQLIRTRLGSRSIVLVGMMGCGKSAVGRRLAPILDLPFVDADDEIERAAGKTIREIFEDHGEPYFRDRERKVMARLMNSGPQVLATGGGAFMAEDTRAIVRRQGISIWLNAELTLLMRRVGKRNHRPLARDIKRLLEVRAPVYATADITVESRDVPHEVIVDEIIEALADSPVLTSPAHGASSRTSSVDRDKAP